MNAKNKEATSPAAQSGAVNSQPSPVTDELPLHARDFEYLIEFIQQPEVRAEARRKLAELSRAQTAPEREADLAWHKESLKRHSEKLHSVWNGIRNAVEKYSGKPCEGEPFDRLDELLAALSAHTAPAVDLASVSDEERAAFEAWSKRDGALNLMAARDAECEDGRFPATYYYAPTETAWRAWANGRAALSRPSAPAPVSEQPAGVPEGIDASDLARIEYCLGVMHSITELGREKLGDLYPEAVTARRALKRVLQPVAEQVIAWMRENREECITAESKRQMESADWGHWREIAKRYVIPLCLAAHPQAVQAKESGNE